MICVTCKSDKAEACFKPSRKNVRGFSLHCADCEHARRKKCRWCEKVSKYHGLCDMHVFRAKQLIQIGHSWSEFEQKEPWLIERQKQAKTCKWCESEHYGKGLCRRHWNRAERAVKRGASWSDFENLEPMLMEKVKKEKAPKPPKPPRKPKQEIVDGMMVCADCNENKAITEYYAQAGNISGLMYRCKTCHNQKIKKKCESNPEFRNQRLSQSSKWRKENGDYKRDCDRKWRNENKARWKELRKKYTSIPIVKVANNLRKRLREFINGERQLPGVGCTRDELKRHIELQFKDGMTWENYGQWHIDHIRPCASFDLLDPEQARQCTHYTNLQPLWAKDNLSKGAKYIKHENSHK